MEFRILGPLEVLDDEGRPIPIHRGKEQALLAYLLLHRNELVASERLIDELWAERPPATAPKILQNAVSQLRKALGEGRLATRPPGYVLRLEPGELDLDRFERLAAEGRKTGDAERLREALAVWRGEPLANLRDELFAQRAALNLEEQRLAVLEDRIEADLAAGRHGELVSELEELVAEHPVRERLYGQLMLALYRGGRQAEALEAYQRARRTLGAELGLEPGPQLQELERRILKQDPALATPARAERQRGPLPLRVRPSFPLAFAAVAVVLVAAAAVSVGLIFALDEHSGPLVAKPNSLAVVDPSRNRVVDVVPVGGTPRGVAVGTNAVWVANSADGTVSQVDTKEPKVLETIGIGAQATDVVETAGSVWVVTGIDNTLVHMDARTGGVLETLRLPSGSAATSYALAVSKGGTLWVVSGNRLLRIDPHSGAIVPGRRSKGHGSLTDVEVGAGAVWVADLSQVVARISAATGSTTGAADLGVIPSALTVGYGSVWVAVPQPGRVWRVAIWRLEPQTVRVTETISLAKLRHYAPTLGIASGMGSIWLTNFADGTLQRVDPATSTVLATIRVGGHPYGVAVGKQRVWVTVD